MNLDLTTYARRWGISLCLSTAVLLPPPTLAEEPTRPDNRPTVTPAEPTQRDPDLQLHLSQAMAQRLTSGTISEPFQVNDTIVGASVRGSGTLRGRYDLMIFDSDRGWWRFKGTSLSDTTAITSDARVSQRTTTQVEAKIPIYWHQNQFVAGRPQVTANANIQRLSAGSNRGSRLFSGAISRRAAAQADADRPTAERESAAKTRSQIEQRMATEVAQELKKWNEHVSDFLAHLTVQDETPPELRFDKVADGIRVSVASQGNLPRDRREVRPIEAAIRLTVGESFLRQLGTANLAGRTVTSTEFADWFGASEVAENDELQVTFSEGDPWQCKINASIIEVQASIAELATPRGSLTDLTIQATYKLHHSKSDGWILTREEPPRLEIGDGSGNVNIRTVAVRRVAINLLQRDLPETIAVEPLVGRLTAEMAVEPTLRLKSIVPHAGRLDVTWEEAQTPVAAGARTQAGFRGLPPSRPVAPESIRP